MLTLFEQFRDPEIQTIAQNTSGSIVVQKKTEFMVSEDIAVKQVDIQRFAESQNIRLDPLSPQAGGTYQGVRWFAVIPPASTAPTLSLRRTRFAEIGMDNYQFENDVRHRIIQAVREGVGIVFVGEPSSGKTTAMFALLQHLCSSARIAVIERYPEIELLSPFWFRLTVGKSGLSGRGYFSLQDCLQAAMRLRPDRLVIGEVLPGEEAVLSTALMMQKGTMATMHGFSREDVFRRLGVEQQEVLPLLINVKYKSFQNAWTMERI